MILSHRAEELFNAYDVDGSGEINLKGAGRTWTFIGERCHRVRGVVYELRQVRDLPRAQVFVPDVRH